MIPQSPGWKDARSLKEVIVAVLWGCGNQIPPLLTPNSAGGEKSCFANSGGIALLITPI
jgi:hypothetical protein